jgi:TolB-like protein/Flp pilus assembly protein TadD
LSLFNELKRRNVFRVALGYIVSSWLLVQVADLVLENIGSPDWVIQTIMLVIALGFPVVVFFSWAYEVTPEGIKRESEIDRSQSITHVTARKLDYSILAVAVLALGYFVWQTQFSDREREAADQPRIEVENEAAIATEESAEPALADTRSIAILPFENRSNREEDQFFTDGIHDDLLSTIAKIGALKVISRTSVSEYRDTTKKLPQIAQELGVANILEGGVQRSGNQVRINVQLIDAASDEHLWAEIYDRDLTTENLFAIQSEISRAIAEALQAALSPEEEQRMDLRPTDNLLAYDAYLRGRQLMASRESAKLKLAIGEFNKAVELDPGFALAWVGVADSNALLSMYGTLAQKDSWPIREEAINRALAIDDQLGEASASLGMLYQDKNQYDQAEIAFRQAIALSPNYATAWHWYSGFMSNYPLRADESIELAQRAAELDPRSPIIGTNLGGKYHNRGLYSMAERQYQKIIELEPGFVPAYTTLANLYTYQMSRYDLALAPALKARELEPDNLSNLDTLVTIYLELGDFAAAERERDAMSEVDANHPSVGFADVFINLRKNNVAATREAVNWMLPKVTDEPGVNMVLGSVELILGDKNRARAIYLSAVPGWLEPDQWQDLLYRYAENGCIVAWVLMNTGDEDLGRRLLQQSTVYLEETLPTADEHADGHAPELCDLTAGNKNKALQSIETQLAHNHLTYWDDYHQLPIYDLIRFEPRYQAAVQERERRIAAQREVINSEAIQIQ